MGPFRELRYELSALFFALGVLGVVLSFTQYLIPTQSPPWLQSIHRAIGQYVVWEALLGLLTVLGGGFYFVDTIRKEREFDRLVSTTSKEVFVKNMKRLEELTYDHLPSAYERRVLHKKPGVYNPGRSPPGAGGNKGSQRPRGRPRPPAASHDEN